MLSVIVLTYNDPLRLRLCLHSLLRQTLTDFELLVVHDGGDREINQPVYEEMRPHGREISELWHGPKTVESCRSATRNLGLRHALGERTLFVDGDCILAPDVVAKHAQYANAPVLINGTRRHLPESSLSWLQPEHFHDLEKYVTQRDARSLRRGQKNHALQARLQNGELIVPLNHEQVWSFQLSVPTDLARAIGGFNETFISYGGEDQEFAGRIKRAGAQLIGRFDLCCYHVDHPLSSTGRNWKLWMQKVQESLRERNPVRNGGPLPGPADAKQKRPPPKRAPKARRRPARK